MRTSRFSFRFIITLVTILCGVTGAKATNLVTKASQPSGNWTAAIWSNAPSGTGSTPSAGNTYELITNGIVWGNNTANTRVRNPATDGLQTFPGDSLTLNTNTDIRFKRGATATSPSPTISNFPGTNGNAGLILNGGILNPGDDVVFIVTGKIHVASQSILSSGDNGGGAQKEARAMFLRGVLTGPGNLVILQSGQTSAHRVDADGSDYTGTWIIRNGFLRGEAGSNTLGFGSIIVAPTNQNAAANSTNFSKVELMYDWNTPGSLILSNNPVSGAPAVCVLHQNLTVSTLIINGTSLAFGSYSYATLASSYPANFAAGGSGNINVTPPTPPGVPPNVTALGGDGQVTLGWAPALFAEGYLIERSGISGGPYTTVGTTVGTNFIDVGVVNNTTNYYVIVATNSLGAGSNSLEVIGVPNEMVTGITAIGGTNQVTLSWTFLPNAASYAVLRSASGSGPFTVLASGLIGTDYVDASALSGSTYFYRIFASLLNGSQSSQSATVSATTAPVTPTLNAVLFASTVIRLGWTASGVVSQFFLESSTDGVNFSPLATQPPNQPSFTNSGLLLGTTYYYRVQATNAGGLSDYSNIASRTTPTNGVNVNFANATNGQPTTPAPTPPGYLQDVGHLFADQGNGYSYGWSTLGGTNITVEGRWRQSANSPDLRYDTFLHLMKANLSDPSVSATWEIDVPNGFYLVHIVSGDAANNNSVYQFIVEGVGTSAYQPVPAAPWGEFFVNCTVADGRLTVQSGPGANNNKMAFIDIYSGLSVPPGVNIQPQGQNVALGGSHSFSVNPYGTPPFSYQWHVNCRDIRNATNATLTVSNVTAADAGNYSVTILNAFGQVTSWDAALEMTNLVIGVGPAIVATLNGTNLNLTWPVGAGIFQLQEASNLNPPPSWVNSAASVSEVDDDYFASVPVSATQKFYRLVSVFPPLRFLSQPLGRSAGLGDLVTLSATPAGTAPFSYQWWLNGFALGGQTNATISILCTNVDQFGAYQVDVRDGSGSATTSRAAVLRLAGNEIALSDSFSGRPLFNTASGSLHGLTFGATKEAGETNHAGFPGDRSVWLSWQAPASGIATFDTIGSGFDTLLAVYEGINLASLTPVASEDDAAAHLWSRVPFNVTSNTVYSIALDGLAGAGGFFNLNWSFLPTPFTIPIIDVPPPDSIINTSETFTTSFTVVAHGVGSQTNLTYQWFYNGNPVASTNGGTNATLNFGGPPPSLPLDLALVYVVVSNATFGVRSHEASLQFSTQPTNLFFVRKLIADQLCAPNGSPETNCCGSSLADAAKKPKPQELWTAAPGTVSALSSGQGATGFNTWRWINEGFEINQNVKLLGSAKVGNDPKACGVRIKEGDLYPRFDLGGQNPKTSCFRPTLNTVYGWGVGHSQTSVTVVTATIERGNCSQ